MREPERGACGKPQALNSCRKVAEIMAEIKSESTKDMAAEELKELQQKVANMTAEELKAFRNSKDADSMGYFGKESV